MEPPEWHYASRTSLGGALLRQGKAEEAESVFRKDLELNPRNAFSLFGLLQTFGEAIEDVFHRLGEERIC